MTAPRIIARRPAHPTLDERRSADLGLIVRHHREHAAAVDARWRDRPDELEDGGQQVHMADQWTDALRATREARYAHQQRNPDDAVKVRIPVEELVVFADDSPWSATAMRWSFPTVLYA